MDLQLSGKHVLITGGSKGIGQACAEVLADEGCNLTLVARDAAALDAAATAIRARRQVQVRTIAADLSNDAAVRQVAQEAGEIDSLVNNAGAIPPGDLLAVDDQTWRLCRAVYPQIKARKNGVILNIIGAAGEKLNPGYIAGSAGNASLIAFTRALGKSSTADGIRVVGINPGATATARLEMLNRDRAEKQFGDAGRWRELFSAMPFGRAATPEEIAWAAAFLISPLSGYTSGTMLTIDGGA